MAQGGLEGLQPSKNHPFLVVVAGRADNNHQKMEIGNLRRSQCGRQPQDRNRQYIQQYHKAQQNV
jgi:hypothetical protein